MNLLDFEGPVWVEPRMRLKKFLLMNKPKMLVAMCLAAAFYLLIVVVVSFNASAIPPVGIIMLQVFLSIFAGISGTHAAISGEREKRTWDTLLVAPISNIDIVTSKTLTALGGQAITWLILLVPALICQVNNSDRPAFHLLVYQEAVAFSYALFLVSSGIFVSSRTKRTFSAQIILYCLQFVCLVVLPAFVAPFAWEGAAPLLSMNPFIALGMSMEQHPKLYVLPFIFFPIISAVLFMAASTGLTNEDGGKRLTGVS